MENVPVNPPKSAMKNAPINPLVLLGCKPLTDRRLDTETT